MVARLGAWCGLWVALSGAAHAAPEMIPEAEFAAAIAPPPGAASLEIPLASGGTFRLSEHNERPVVLAFWASWCGPCRQELPALSEWAKAHPEVEVLAVGVDRSPADAQRFLAAVKFDLPVAYDAAGEHLGRFGVISMPTSFLFDREGAMRWQHSGYSAAKGFSELEAAIGALK